MKIFCVTTDKNSYRDITENCIRSIKKRGYEVEKYFSVPIGSLEEVAKNNNTFLKYTANKGNVKTDFEKRTCPDTRISNGLTHYLIYKWAYENNTSVCILEADATLIGKLPDPIDDGIIQISSHKRNQFTVKSLYTSGRAKKMEQWAPKEYAVWSKQFDWDCLKKEGIIKHPCTGTIGTSGYIVGPAAAKRLLDYFTSDGIGFADRVREDHIGKGNLYLQVPQSVVVRRHGQYPT